MKQKLFTLLTLLVLCVTGAWAQTRVDVKDITVTSGSVTSQPSVTGLTYTFGPSASWGIGNATHTEGGYDYTKKLQSGNNPTSGGDAVGENKSKHIPDAGGFIKFEPSVDATLVLVSLYGGNKSEDIVIGTSEATCSHTETAKTASDWTTTIEMEKGKTYYIYWRGSKITIMGFVFTPKKPSTSTTVNAPKSNQTAIVDNSGSIGTISDNKCTLSTSYPLSILGSGSDSKIFEAGSDNYKFTVGGSDCTAIKVKKGCTYIVEPSAGITINSVTAYATSNSDDYTSAITSGTLVNEELAKRSHKSDPHTPASFTLQKNGEEKFYFTISDVSAAGQAIVVLDINYDISENVDVAVSSAGYATLYYGEKLAIPAGITAYSATVSGSNIVLTEVDDVIPANNGVILKGDPGTYNFIVTTAAAPSISENILTGTTTATTKAALGGTVYTLGQDGEGVVGLRSFTGSDIRAYSAYSTSISLARDFYAFDEDVTAINKVEAKKVETNVFYNLAGQQVAQPSKGLYIVNGKKVIIK